MFFLLHRAEDELIDFAGGGPGAKPLPQQRLLGIRTKMAACIKKAVDEIAKLKAAELDADAKAAQRLRKAILRAERLAQQEGHKAEAARAALAAQLSLDSSCPTFTQEMLSAHAKNLISAAARKCELHLAGCSRCRFKGGGCLSCDPDMALSYHMRRESHQWSLKQLEEL